MSKILLALLLLSQAPAPLQPRTGVVTGILRTNAGIPLEGVRVAVTPAEGALADDLLESMGLTDKDGRYRLENVSPGRYNIVVARGINKNYHPGVTQREGATVINVAAGATVAVSDVVFARVSVSGRVINWATGAGRRVQDLRICCEYSLTGTSLLGRTATGSGIAFTASVKDDGTFVFDGVPRGNFTIQASDPGIIAMGQSLTVSDADVNGLEVKVSSGVEVQGNVLDRLGVPVPGVVARLNPRATNTAFNVAPNTIVSVNGTSAVLFSVFGNASSNTIDALQSALRLSVKTEVVTVGSDGRFSIGKVLPGLYLLEVNAPGMNLIEREIEVGPLGVAGLRVEVPFTRLEGRVVAGGPDPLPKLEGSIRIIPAAPGSQILYLFPDGDGRFLPLLAPGEYRVSTENLGRSVRSVRDGARDLATEPLIFDGVRKPEILVTLEP